MTECKVCQKRNAMVINHYGQAEDDLECDLEDAIDWTCKNLDPVEVRLLGLYVAERVSGKFAEIVLRKALDMRKASRRSN